MELTTFAVLFVLAAFLLALVKRTFVVLPARRFAIVERLGTFDRVLWPGFHVLKPWEGLKTVRWSFPGQDGKLVISERTILSFDNAQMDVPPVQCVTKDQIQVTLDGTLIYNISKPQVAVYETEDVLNMFYQCTQQAIRNSVSAFEVQQLEGKDNELGSRIQDYINSKIVDKGVACSMFLVQALKIDKKILDANEKIYVKSRQAKMAMEEQRSEHERTMASLQQRMEKERTEQTIELQSKTFRFRMQAAEAQARAEQDKCQFDVLASAGFTTAQILELERVRAMTEVARSSNKVIYAPLPFFESAQATHKLE